MCLELYGKESFFTLLREAPGIACIADTGLGKEEEAHIRRYLRHGWVLVVFMSEADCNYPPDSEEAEYCHPLPWVSRSFGKWASQIYWRNVYPESSADVIQQVSLCCALAGQKHFPPATFPTTIDDAKIPRDLYHYPEDLFW